MSDKLTVALAQIAPIWLDRDRTIAKVLRAMKLPCHAPELAPARAPPQEVGP